MTDAVSPDKGLMHRALGLAARGQGRTFPNPLVGCVITDRSGEIIGEGWHSRCGAPHAEVEALRAAGDRAFGGTMVVTLEPCCHHGRTPPCTDAIVEAGIARVVIALQDPNPGVCGRGTEILRNAGIEVVTGVMEAEAVLLNEVYIHFLEKGRSLLHLKLAVSLDGRTAAADGSSRWISGGEARNRVHLMRKSADGVMIGAGTARRDHPSLTARGVDCPPERQPVRIVVTSGADTDFASRLPRTGSGLVVALPEGTDDRAIRNVTASGGKVWLIPADYGGVDLELLLRRTAEEGLGYILCEGGHTLATSLLRMHLVDRISIITSPVILGKEGFPVLGRLGIESIDSALHLSDVSTETLGADCLIEGKVVYRAD